MSISVLASVYSKERPEHLEESLQSLTQQTMKDFEVILVEDGPLSKQLEEVIRKFKEKLPLVSVKLEKNMGLARALNEGLLHCKFNLIARMDTDDIALPHRLQIQKRFMDNNPQIAVCSSWIEERDETMKRVMFLKKVPVDHKNILTFAKLRNPINHPASMFRKDVVLASNGYPHIFPEDYALWSVLLREGYQFSNIPQVLLYMRTGSDFFDRRGMAFLKGELKLLKFQKEIGFLTTFEYYRNMLVRIAVRLPPKRIRRLFYSSVR